MKKEQGRMQEWVAAQPRSGVAVPVLPSPAVRGRAAAAPVPAVTHSCC